MTPASAAEAGRPVGGVAPRPLAELVREALGAPASAEVRAERIKAGVLRLRCADAGTTRSFVGEAPRPGRRPPERAGCEAVAPRRRPGRRRSAPGRACGGARRLVRLAPLRGPRRLRAPAIGAAGGRGRRRPRRRYPHRLRRARADPRGPPLGRGPGHALPRLQRPLRHHVAARAAGAGGASASSARPCATGCSTVWTGCSGSRQRGPRRWPGTEGRRRSCTATCGL